MSSIKPKHRTLADRIKAISGIDDKGQGKDNNNFRTIATEDGIDVDRLITEQDYVSDYMTAQRLAFGEDSIEFLKNNKDTPTVSGVFEIGKNRLELSFDRHARVPNRTIDKETGNFVVDGEKDVYGISNVKYKVRGANGSKGEMKAVGEFLQGEARKAFAS